MKKFIVTLYAGRFPCNYYVEVSQNRNEFIFSPGYNSHDYPQFMLSMVDGQLECEGEPGPELRKQAEHEIRSLLSNSLPERIHSYIRSSFLGEGA